MTACRRFIACLLLLCMLPLAAQDFRAFADDIAQRLDATNELYQQGKTDEAKQKVQMAYFEVFEKSGRPLSASIFPRRKARKWKRNLAISAA